MEMVNQRPVPTCRGMMTPFIPLRSWSRGPEGLRWTDWYERQEQLYEWIRYNRPAVESTNLHDLISAHSASAGSSQANLFGPMRGQTGVIIALGGTVTELVVFGHPKALAERWADIVKAAQMDAALLKIALDAPPAWTSQAERLVHDALYEFAGGSPDSPNRGDPVTGASTSYLRIEANGRSALTEAVFSCTDDGSAEQLAVFSAFPARAF